jgi:hypothetical protein
MVCGRSRRDTALAGIRAELVTRLSRLERTFETEKTMERLIKRLLRERHRTREWVPPAKDGWEKLWKRPAARVSQSYRRARAAPWRGPTAMEAARRFTTGARQ